MFEAIVNDLEKWLLPLTGEVVPRITVLRRQQAVLLEPWVDPSVTAVEVRLAPLEDGGTLTTVLAYSPQSDLCAEERKWTRYRLGTVFGAALREWVDEPHW